MSETVGGSENLRRDRILDDDSLDVAGSIAHDQKLNLAAGSLVVHPTLQRHLSSDMFADVFYVGGGHNLYFNLNSSMESCASYQSFSRRIRDSAPFSGSPPRVSKMNGP